MEEERERAAKEEKKPSKVLPILIRYVAPIPIIALVGYIGYLRFFKEERKPTPEALRLTGIVIDGPSLIVNLSDRNVPRFLKVKMTFELESRLVADEIVKKEPMIKDAVISLLSSKTMADVRGPEAMQLLKDEVIARVNAYLSGGRIINVYFTEFVAQ